MLSSLVIAFLPRSKCLLISWLQSPSAVILAPWIVTCSLLCPWDSPGKNTGVGCHFLLQWIFQTQGSNLGLLHCRQTFTVLSLLSFCLQRLEGPKWLLDSHAEVAVNKAWVNWVLGSLSPLAPLFSLWSHRSLPSLCDLSTSVDGLLINIWWLRTPKLIVCCGCSLSVWMSD